MRGNAVSRPEKIVDGRLRVHAWAPGGFLSAGLLTLQEDGEAMAASFEYDPAYLATPGAYPLDPLNLPLARTTWATMLLPTLGAGAWLPRSYRRTPGSECFAAPSSAAQTGLARWCSPLKI